jgi:hypothetical protein
VCRIMHGHKGLSAALQPPRDKPPTALHTVRSSKNSEICLLCQRPDTVHAYPLLLCCNPPPPGRQPQQQTHCLAPAYSSGPEALRQTHTNRPTELTTDTELSQYCSTCCDSHTSSAVSACGQWYEPHRK